MEQRIDGGAQPAQSGRLMEIYRRLFNAFGPQHWWPGETPFEVIVGAILTQSTAWTNVEKAIRNLKAAGALSAPALRSMQSGELARLIRSSGYYNAKAEKIHAFVNHLAKYGDDLGQLFRRDLERLREELLAIHGVGEETADSILLYAGHRPSFVIDAYTRRIVGRLGIEPPGGRYGDYRRMFQGNLPEDVPLFNEYHALLVRLGKDICRKRAPTCSRCPLLALCPTGQGGGGEAPPAPSQGRSRP